MTLTCEETKAEQAILAQGIEVPDFPKYYCVAVNQGNIHGVPISRIYTVEEMARTAGKRLKSEYPDCFLNITTDLRNDDDSRKEYLEIRTQELIALKESNND